MLAQQIVNAVSAGSIYALFALGFTLVFGVLDRLNLAHAAVYTAGAFAGIELVADAGRRSGGRCRRLRRRRRGRW